MGHHEKTTQNENDDHTRLNLNQEKHYRPFIDGYIKVLQFNLKQIKHIGYNYIYTTYTCGEPHDRRKPNWKSSRLLRDYCEQTGYDFYVVRDIIYDRLDRKLVCERELQWNDEKRLRMDLEGMFGVDFGRPGWRRLGLV